MAAEVAAGCPNPKPPGEDTAAKEDRLAVFKHSSPKKNAIREWNLGGDENANVFHAGSAAQAQVQSSPEAEAAQGVTEPAEPTADTTQREDQTGQSARAAGAGSPSGGAQLAGSAPCHSLGNDQDVPPRQDVSRL